MNLFYACIFAVLAAIAVAVVLPGMPAPLLLIFIISGTGLSIITSFASRRLLENYPIEGSILCTTAFVCGGGILGAFAGSIYLMVTGHPAYAPAVLWGSVVSFLAVLAAVGYVWRREIADLPRRLVVSGHPGA